MCTFGVLGLSCEATRPRSRRGFTRQPKSPNVHIRAPRRFKHHQNSTRRPPEREERVKIVAGEGRKRAKFWAVLGRMGPGKDGPGKGGLGKGGLVEGGGPGEREVRRNTQILDTPTKISNSTTPKKTKTHTTHTTHTQHNTQHTHTQIGQKWIGQNWPAKHSGQKWIGQKWIGQVGHHRPGKGGPGKGGPGEGRSGGRAVRGKGGPGEPNMTEPKP